MVLIAVVPPATFLPCSGQTTVIFEWAASIGIDLLLLLHGAKLLHQAIVAGITH